MLDHAPCPPGLDDARLLRFVGHAATGRLVTAVQPPDAPFPIARVFTVTTDRAAVRGGAHAHKRCHQLIICVAGFCRLEVIADDPNERRTFDLPGPEQGVHLPPGLWGEQVYGPAGSVIMVLCDRPYEADDYLRDFEAYRAWRRGAGA